MTLCIHRSRISTTAYTHLSVYTQVRVPTHADRHVRKPRDGQGVQRRCQGSHPYVLREGERDSRVTCRGRPPCICQYMSASDSTFLRVYKRVSTDERAVCRGPPHLKYIQDSGWMKSRVLDPTREDSTTGKIEDARGTYPSRKSLLG